MPSEEIDQTHPESGQTEAFGSKRVTVSALTGVGEQWLKSYRNPIEDINKMLSRSLAPLSAVEGFKSSLYAEMKVPSALTVVSEQWLKSYRNPVEDINKMLSRSLALSGAPNFMSPLADVEAARKISSLSNAWLTEFQNDGADGLVASLREDIAVDPSLAREVEEIFERLGAPEDLLQETAEFLNLTVPFGHDAAVRTGLQVLAVTSLFAILLMIFLHNPVLGAVLSAGGTPNVVVSWKATGKAYDRLYGIDAKPKAMKKTGAKRKAGPLARKHTRKRSSRW